MQRIALIGTGIAGMACAHRLHPFAEITLFEQHGTPGGHTNTVTVDDEGTQVPVDTGFMVFNRRTYPELTRLFAALEVPLQRTDMSFGVHHRPSGMAYSSNGLSGLFAQPFNALRPNFLRLLRDLPRFNSAARQALQAQVDPAETLAAFCRRQGLSHAFLDGYLLPMGAAIWSSSTQAMGEFPAAALLRFFDNHGLLNLRGHLPWLTVQGGSQVYRERLLAPFRDRIRTGTPIVEVERDARGARIVDRSGGHKHFDHVVVATHADQALRILANPTPTERRLLSAFTYSENHCLLHSDSSVMPPARRAWASWNVRFDRARAQASTHYWMNSLQRVSDRRNFFVTLNGQELVDPATVHYETTYHHPTFTPEAFRAQAELPCLNKDGPLYFCGSYFRYGFHEDALVSGYNAAAALLRNLNRIPAAAG